MVGNSDVQYVVYLHGYSFRGRVNSISVISNSSYQELDPYWRENVPVITNSLSLCICKDLVLACKLLVTYWRHCVRAILETESLGSRLGSHRHIKDQAQ